MTPPEKIRVLFAWQAMGPYHAARMKALAARPELELTVARLRERDPQRAWELTDDDLGQPIHLVRDLTYEQLAELDVAVVAGWFEDELIALTKRLPTGCRRVVFGDSCEHDRPRRAWKEAIKRWRLRLFDACFAAGKLSRAYFMKLGIPGERAFMIGDVADPAPFEAARDAHQSGDGDLITSTYPQLKRSFILYAGRLAPEKNILSMVEGFGELVASEKAETISGEKVDLVLAGSGPLREELERMIAELELQDRVHLLGETKPEPLAALMAGCCFLVLPSTCEPWGLVVNEAMHAGRPVLGSQACGCAPELLQSGAAWLLRGFGAGDLAEGMERALADKPNWNTMGKHATEIAAEFKPDRHAEIVVEALQQVMALPEGRR